MIKIERYISQKAIELGWDIEAASDNWFTLDLRSTYKIKDLALYKHGLSQLVFKVNGKDYDELLKKVKQAFQTIRPIS